MSHEFKRQVGTNQTPALFSIRILHENWEEGKSKSLYLSYHHTSLLLFKNRQLKAHNMVTGQSPGFSGHSAPLKEAVSCTTKREVPAAAYLHCRGWNAVSFATRSSAHRDPG